MTDTDLILRHLDASSGLISKRLDDLTTQLTAMNGSVKVALVDAAAARIVADAALLKVGEVHTANKALRSAFDQAQAGASAVQQRDGHAIRQRDVWLIALAIGGLSAAVGGLVAVLTFGHYAPHL